MKSGLGKIFLKFLHALTMSFLLLNFDQKYKFSNKNNMVSAWRNFKNIFPRSLFIIIFRPEMLKLHPYSILTGDTRVEFAIYCVLSLLLKKIVIKPNLFEKVLSFKLTFLRELLFSKAEENLSKKTKKKYLLD